MRKDIFEALGCFQNIPLMEDYELVKLVHRLFPSTVSSSSLGPVCGVVVLREKVQTSARRWREKGVLTTTIMNQVSFLCCAILISYHFYLLDCVVRSCCRCPSSCSCQLVSETNEPSSPRPKHSHAPLSSLVVCRYYGSSQKRDY
jgi:hypothetical protein